MPSLYKRTPQELELHATKFWSPEISRAVSDASEIPLLLSTQEQFFGILAIPVANIEGVLNVLEASTFPANLFVKHLMVLANFGNEPFKRTSREFTSLFPDGLLDYIWNGMTQQYRFRAAPGKIFSNQSLKSVGKDLARSVPLTDIMRDAIAILLAGALATDEATAFHFNRCEIGNYIGEPEKLRAFVKQRYIWVSQITGGARNNSRGQLLQQMIIEQLRERLGESYFLRSNHTIPGIKHTHEDDARLTHFDVVVAHDSGKFIAVEISFQETTNSTIERKAGQAQPRYIALHGAGYRIAYVIDGAGNFERQSALRTICEYSDCTVGFSPEELDVLAEFIRDYINGVV
jgi:hypothetical protein